MLAITMLLLTAAPVADWVRVKHPAPVVRTVKIGRASCRERVCNDV